MGTALVIGFFAFFALAIGQGIMRRKRNPYADVSYEELPASLRTELERVLPGFAGREAKLTKEGDEARMTGNYQGVSFRIEGEFDREGRLVEFEADGAGGFRTRGLSELSELTDQARKEIDRVLGQGADALDRLVVKHGSFGGEDAFEVDGRDGEWKWEVAVTATGQLLEVEREKRRH